MIHSIKSFLLVKLQQKGRLVISFSEDVSRFQDVKGGVYCVFAWKRAFLVLWKVHVDNSSKSIGDDLKEDFGVSIYKRD